MLSNVCSQKLEIARLAGNWNFKNIKLGLEVFPNFLYVYILTKSSDRTPKGLRQIFVLLTFGMKFGTLYENTSIIQFCLSY